VSKLSNTLQLDVLDTFETIKIAIAYKIDGEVSDADNMMIDGVN
jgi:adenylosuccinate synthase